MLLQTDVIFAVAGGVAKAVTNVLKEKYPDLEVKACQCRGTEGM